MRGNYLACLCGIAGSARYCWQAKLLLEILGILLPAAAIARSAGIASSAAAAITEGDRYCLQPLLLLKVLDRHC